MKLTEDVSRIDGVRGANTYLVTSEDGLLLVDSGMPGNGARILAAIEGSGHKPADLRYIVLTHSDIDHVGSVAEVKEASGASVAIHEADAPVLAGEAAPKRAKGVRGLVLGVLSRFMSFRPVNADILLRDGDTIGGFHVMHTPGHTPGSITLYREDGVVFCGDALLGDDQGRVRPPRASLTLDLDQASASAQKIESLRFTTLLPGHGKPVLRKWL